MHTGAHSGLVAESRGVSQLVRTLPALLYYFCVNREGMRRGREGILVIDGIMMLIKWNGTIVL